MIKALIIDDEKPARDLIRIFLKPYSDIEVAGECANGFEALKMITDLSPDLLFLDIRMPKISGLELLELLDNPPVTVFSTAYDEHALKAFEMNAVDYLLKPYSEDRFRQAIDKARSKLSEGTGMRSSLDGLVRDTVKQNGFIERIVVKNGTRIQIITLDQVSHVEAKDDYVEIHTPGGVFTKKMTMKFLEENLPSNIFYRVHRSVIVRLDVLQKIEPYSKDSYLGITKMGEKIPISRAGYKKLRELLNM